MQQQWNRNLYHSKKHNKEIAHLQLKTEKLLAWMPAGFSSTAFRLAIITDFHPQFDVIVVQYGICMHIFVLFSYKKKQHSLIKNEFVRFSLPRAILYFHHQLKYFFSFVCIFFLLCNTGWRLQSHKHALITHLLIHYFGIFDLKANEKPENWNQFKPYIKCVCVVDSGRIGATTVHRVNWKRRASTW